MRLLWAIGEAGASNLFCDSEARRAFSDMPTLRGKENSVTTTLPQFLRDLLACPPRTGEGVHGWLFKVARQLHAHYADKGQITALLAAAVEGCGRDVPRREIQAAVEDAAACAWRPDAQASQSMRKPKWPSVNAELRAKIIAGGLGLADLWECSPLRIESNAPHTEELIDALFPGNPLLCCGRTSYEFATKPRDDWRGHLDTLALIVPSPMTATTGRTKDGSRESAHTLDNTGPRRFLVVEFDSGTLDEHAAILLHLANFGPLVLSVFSGSKSLHGWFACLGQPEDKVHRFFRYAVTLGADSATWTRSQFVRMPDGTRDNGRRQSVYFFNPQLAGKLP